MVIQRCKELRDSGEDLLAVSLTVQGHHLDDCSADTYHFGEHVAGQHRHDSHGDLCEKGVLPQGNVPSVSLKVEGQHLDDHRADKYHFDGEHVAGQRRHGKPGENEAPPRSLLDDMLLGHGNELEVLNTNSGGPERQQTSSQKSVHKQGHVHHGHVQLEKRNRDHTTPILDDMNDSGYQHRHVQHRIPKVSPTTPRYPPQNSGPAAGSHGFSGLGEGKLALLGVTDRYAGVNAIFCTTPRAPQSQKTPRSMTSKSGALPSLTGTLTKLEADRVRHAENSSRLMHRAGHVTHFVGRLVSGISTKNGSSTKKGDKSNVVQTLIEPVVDGSSTKNGDKSNVVRTLTEPMVDGSNTKKSDSSNVVRTLTEPVVSAHHHWVKHMSWVWAFLVKETQLVKKRHVHNEGIDLRESPQSTCSTAAPPSPQDPMLLDISLVPTSAAGMVDTDSTFGKTSEVETFSQSSSGKPYKVSKHEVHAHSHHHARHAHVHCHSRKGSPEEMWTLDDASSEFSDENLLILFEFFANHKDYSGRQLMALDEWNKFFVIFEEHFQGTSPGITKLSHFFTKNLNLQVDMHFAYGMEKGEASRGLTFEYFKIALHETVGHHWHHADMQESWDDTMSRQSHGIIHGMA